MNTVKIQRHQLFIWLLLVVSIAVNALFNTILFCIPLFLGVTVLCVKTILTKRDFYSICMFALMILVSLAVVYDIAIHNSNILHKYLAFR